MRLLKPADYRVMPWKNGGGSTAELYRELADPELPFLWRVSIAGVSADGPFSLFPGYDRHILVLEGGGMVLEGGPDGPVNLTQHFQPRRFSGDWPIRASLRGSPLKDFNLMALRSELDSDLRVAHLGQPQRLKAGLHQTLLVHIIGARVHANGLWVANGESLVAVCGENVLLEPQDRAIALIATVSGKHQ
ncbi:HutD family protein [Aestuariivirga sp.]|uniref:HutD/Ves family protein n=1 Tax=Aestuariivirga sp. TaxID=2650926 RepID=UPI0039E507C8